MECRRRNEWRHPRHGMATSNLPYLDAFLSATKSVPEIISTCFGEDTPNKEMQAWWKALPDEEKERRKEFAKQFKPHHKAFSDLPLSEARNISEHRRGYADVTVTISGRWGVTHVGTPTQPVPSAELPKIDRPESAFLGRPAPIRPTWNGFTINGQGLFPACEEYRQAANALVATARVIVERVHGDKPLTPPPA
jgi:hypothetical protein